MARDREKKRKIVIGYLRRGQSASAGFAAADSIKIGLSISLLFGRFIFSFSQKTTSTPIFREMGNLHFTRKKVNVGESYTTSC